MMDLNTVEMAAGQCDAQHRKLLRRQERIVLRGLHRAGFFAACYDQPALLVGIPSCLVTDLRDPSYRDRVLRVGEATISTLTVEDGVTIQTESSTGRSELTQPVPSTAVGSSVEPAATLSEYEQPRQSRSLESDTAVEVASCETLAASSPVDPVRYKPALDLNTTATRKIADLSEIELRARIRAVLNENVTIHRDELDLRIRLSYGQRRLCTTDLLRIRAIIMADAQIDYDADETFVALRGREVPVFHWGSMPEAWRTPDRVPPVQIAQAIMEIRASGVAGDDKDALVRQVAARLGFQLVTLAVGKAIRAVLPMPAPNTDCDAPAPKSAQLRGGSAADQMGADAR